jgi:NAD(P)H dehydrogenase (quinone)
MSPVDLEGLASGRFRLVDFSGSDVNQGQVIQAFAALRMAPTESFLVDRERLPEQWLLYIAPMIKAGLLHVPFGTGKHAPIAAEDQGRVIAGILEDPATHAGKIYPLFGPVEYTYRETAQLLSRVLGKSIEYKQVSYDDFLGMLKSGRQNPAEGASARNLYGELGGKSNGSGDSFTVQHLKEVAIDHQNGIFEGTNDLVEKLGGRPPMTLEAFIAKHRNAFE